MARQTVTYIICDMCGAEIDSSKRDYGMKYELVASAHDYSSGGPELIWKDLCTDCNSTLREVVASLKRVSTERRRAREAE